MNKVKKIVFLLPNNVAGGAERVVTTLCNEFSKKNIEITLITFDSTSNFYNLEKKVNYIRLNLGTEKMSKLKKYLILLKYEIKRYHKIKENLEKIRPDCVISFMFMTNIIGCFCCKKLGIPIILSERNDPTKYSFVKRLIMKHVYSKADGLVCQSTKIMKYSEKKYHLKNITVIANPLNDNQISNEVSAKENKIINVGRMIKQKNQKLLISAFSEISKEYPEYTLYIYGDGPLRKKLEKQIEKLNLKDKVFLPGIEKDVIKNNRNTELFVLTSIFEGYPNVLVEAMANGICSLSSKFPSGTAEDIIKNGYNGFLFENNNLDDLINKMRDLLKNKKLIENCSNNGTKIYENINIKIIIKEWENYIEKVINKE